ncbi:hypothetical protein SteCoe_30143 [Stentor coeruleus]|uniref:Potassium channel domain-containing protein n=1 Tax=Stentor coeruleus TaxID=5963 RepID=A0A1R2B4C6_9CILI|nr:hypothetical protein SteCoe_30143 [Stentor coeruleus]
MRNNFEQLEENIMKRKFIRSSNKKKIERVPEDQMLFRERREDMNETNEKFEKLKLAEMACLTLSSAGFGCSVISANLIDEPDIHKSSIYLTLPLVLSTLTTIVLLFAIYWRSQKQLKWEQCKLIYSAEDDMSTTNKIRYVILEIVINAIHPIYGMHGVEIYMYNEVLGVTLKYKLSLLLTVVMMLRVYHIVRFISSVSKYKTSRCQRLCKIYGAQPDNFFALKCIMQEGPVSVIAWMFVSGMLIAAYALRVFEAPTVEYGGKDFSTFGNAIWCVIVTMATVGYGDYYPVTLPGRIVGFIACIWGVLTVSLTTVTFSNLLSLNLGEETSLKLLERLWFKENIKEEAAWVLTTAVRYKLMCKNTPDDKRKIHEQFDRFRYHFKKFQFLRNKQKNLYDFDCYTDRIEMKLLEIIDKYEKAVDYITKSEEIIEFFQLQALD